MKIRYTRRAASDLAAILSSIDERSPRGAERVKKRLQAVIGNLADQPLLGRLTQKRDVRRLVVNPYPYPVFY